MLSLIPTNQETQEDDIVSEERGSEPTLITTQQSVSIQPNTTVANDSTKTTINKATNIIILHANVEAEKKEVPLKDGETSQILEAYLKNKEKYSSPNGNGEVVQSEQRKVSRFSEKVNDFNSHTGSIKSVACGTRTSREALGSFNTPSQSPPMVSLYSRPHLSPPMDNVSVGTLPNCQLISLGKLDRGLFPTPLVFPHHITNTNPNDNGFSPDGRYNGPSSKMLPTT